ncbi:tyrosine-type recombinase/integrase [Aquibacillus kalidii]|uniref:tyrosine-type recombinase/integrase n=1 Tax=Aquibacillus kalidii TaxID=2762597 RepID=UPI002E2B2047|nr:tyrosine-type recombinase/integrase [Aquibacillus kalidii]
MKNIEFHLDNFMLYCDSKNLSRKSLKSYEQTIRLFQLYLENEHKITEVNEIRSGHIRQYIKYLRERGKYTVVSNGHYSKINYPDRRTDLGHSLSDTTIANYLRNIKVFFNFLYKEREIVRNPVENIENIKPTRKQKQLLKPEEIKRLLNTMDITKFHEYRLWIQVRLCLDTGIRAGECVELMPNDIDFKYSSLLVRNPKNHKERYVYFSRKMNVDLKRWIQYRDRFSDSDYLFPTIRGTKQDVRNFERSLRKVGEKVNINVHPHLLRNSFAKYYLTGGIGSGKGSQGDFSTLSRILGHSSAEVTARAYLDFTDDEIRLNYQRHSPLNNLDL